MGRHLMRIGTFAFALVNAVPYASAMPAHGFTNMAEGSTVVPPKGFREFCQREPGECEEKATKRNVVSLTPERLAQLQQVQRLINERIAYQSDRETYGRSEYWNYPETW